MYLSRHARGTLAFVVTLLALTQIAGAALMSSNLLHIGMALGFAPLPRPFGAVHGYENFATRITAVLTFANGREQSVDLNPLVSHLSGPHRAKIAVIQGFIYMPTYSRAFTAPLLTKTLCDSLPSMIGAERPARAELEIRSDTIGWENYLYTRTISCAEL